MSMKFTGKILIDCAKSSNTNHRKTPVQSIVNNLAKNRNTNIIDNQSLNRQKVVKKTSEKTLILDVENSNFYRKFLYQKDREAKTILAFDKIKFKGFLDCGKKVINTFVEIHKTNQNKTVFSGLAHCNSVWICPSCNLKISTYRKNEIKTILTNYLSENKQNQFDLITLTIKHNRNEKYETVLNRLIENYTSLVRENSFKKLCKKYKIQGFIRTLETTFNHSGGWHPHFHIIYLHQLKESEYTKFSLGLFAIWNKIHIRNFNESLSIKGFAYKKDSIIKKLQKKNIELSIDQIANYMIDSVALETTAEQCKTNAKQDSKAYNGLSYFQMLCEPKKYINQIKEYAQTIKGHRKYTFSKDLRKKYLNELTNEKTDKEIINDVTELACIQFLISKKIWYAMHYNENQELLLNFLDSNPNATIQQIIEGITELTDLQIKFDYYDYVTKDKEIITVPLFSVIPQQKLSKSKHSSIGTPVDKNELNYIQNTEFY